MEDSGNSLIVTGIDPGPKFTAYTVFCTDGSNHQIVSMGKVPNSEMMSIIKNGVLVKNSVVFIEGMQAMGMPVGAETFETCYFIGKILEVLEQRDVDHRLIFRKEVKLHHCGTNKAKDANIRAALIERFGGVGTKKEQGLLYGVKADIWSSTAIAVMGADRILNDPLT